MRINRKELAEILKVQLNSLKNIELNNQLEQKLLNKGYAFISKEKIGRNNYYIVEKIGEPKKKFPQFLPNEEYNNSIGIYKIVLDNKIYIGSTVSGFRYRFLSHKNKGNKLETRQLLEQGAVFDIIQICDGMEESEIRQIENEWIEEFRNNPDWIVVNQVDHVRIKGEQHGKSKNISDNKIIKVKREDYDRALEILEREGIGIVNSKI